VRLLLLKTKFVNPVKCFLWSGLLSVLFWWYSFKQLPCVPIIVSTSFQRKLVLGYRYFGDLVHDAIKVRQVQNTDQNLAVLLRIADEALTNRNFSTAGHFVAYFSEVEDDLGQWRGYGGGECGYAIGFSVEGILEAKARSRV